MFATCHVKAQVNIKGDLPQIQRLSQSIIIAVTVKLVESHSAM